MTQSQIKRLKPQMDNLASPKSPTEKSVRSFGGWSTKKKRTQPQVGVWIQGNDHGHHYTLEEVFEFARQAHNNPATTTHIMVGTDSHGFGASYHFVTVLCIWNVGKGGTYFYKSALEPRKAFSGSQKMRLQDEVTKSLEVAFALEEKTGIKPEVHIDASPPEIKEFSSSFSEGLCGYVVSSGYDAVLKPDSIASNCIADRYARKRPRKRNFPPSPEKIK